MRVVSGTAGGRRLVAPPGREVRPTTDRVRESIFNALGSLGAIDGVEVLDLFAGSGALGIEALSRGAEQATFVERDRGAADVVRANLDTTGLADRAEVVVSEAERYLASAGGRFDLVLLDPPYAYDAWGGLLRAVAPLVADAGIVVIESGGPVELPEGWLVEREKRYGGTLVAFARPPHATEPD